MLLTEVFWEYSHLKVAFFSTWLVPFLLRPQIRHASDIVFVGNLEFWHGFYVLLFT